MRKDSYTGIPSKDRAEVRRQLAHYRDSVDPQIVYKVMVERRQRPTEAEQEAQRAIAQRESPVNLAVDGIGLAVSYLTDLVDGSHGEMEGDLLSVCVEGMAALMRNRVGELREALEQERRPKPQEEQSHV